MTDIESRLTVALADTARRNLPDATVPPPFRPDPVRQPSRIRAWALPALAAAVVVALAVGVLAGTKRGSDRVHPTGPLPGSVVTLRAQEPLSAVQAYRAMQILTARAVALGAQRDQVQYVGDPDKITMVLPGVTPAEVGDLGAPTVLQFRPLVVNQTWPATPKPASSGSSAATRRVVDPWQSLGFPPPTDATGYQALSRTQQNAIQAVIGNWDCRNAPPNLPSAPIVACDSGRTAKYLLGPAIVTGDQIRTASALSPGGVIGQFQWTVNVDLTAAGQQRWTSYTAQHNEQAHPGADANVVADVLDGDVLVASTIEATITGTTQITGNFTQRSATVLAGFLSAGPLPAPFEVVSVKSN